MRIDGVSSQAYPIKRKPRKANAVVDEGVEDIVDAEIELADTPVSVRGEARTANLPAR